MDQHGTDPEDRDGRQAGQHRSERRGPAADPGELGERLVRRGTERQDALAVPIRAVEGHEVGHAGELVDDRRPQLAPRHHQRQRGPSRQPPSGHRKEHTGERHEREQHEPEHWIEHADDQAREGDDRRGDDGRDHDPDVEVLEGVDVGDDPAEQVAASLAGQDRGRDRFDRRVEPDAKVGQDVEGRPVGDVSLEVPEGRAGDREDADGRDRQRDVRDVRHECRLRDQVGRHGHERHIRADREEPEARTDRDPAPVPGEEADQSTERRHGNSRAVASSRA
jgi:hypothetical protein